MSSLSTASKRNDRANDEAFSLSDTLIATSPLTQSSQSASVYRGSKGSHHRKHANPRQIKEKDLTQDFISLCCDNNDDNFLAIIARYKRLDKGDAVSKEQATGMLASFYELGVRERMFREVFGIGSSRYSRIVSGAPPRSRGGKNVFAVDTTMLASLAAFIELFRTASFMR